MDDGSILSVIIIAVLLAFSAYFSMSETAYASVSRIKLKTLADRGDSRAKRAVYVAENFDKAISAILIGNNIVNLSAAAYVTVLVTRQWGVSAVTLSTIISTVVVFFVGELFPKSFGKKYSERLALATASSLCFFMRIFSPIAKLLTLIGNAAARLTKGDSAVTVTEDELHDIIENMTDEGELDSEQGELVYSALTFGEVTVESIVTSRMDMASVDVDDSPREIMDFLKAQRHSRFPVYEGTVDNVIGILKMRKFINAYLAQGDSLQLRPLLDEAYFVHQSTNIDELLPVMSSKKLNMAIVTDNYGGTLGIVTVEDILEELVGEIWDEDDVVVESCTRNADGSFSFDASVDIEDAFQFMDYEDPDEFDFEHKLLGEWAYEQFDHIPQEGDSFSYNGLSVTVAQVNSRRILKLEIRLLPDDIQEGGEDK